MDRITFTAPGNKPVAIIDYREVGRNVIVRRFQDIDDESAKYDAFEPASDHATTTTIEGLPGLYGQLGSRLRYAEDQDEDDLLRTTEWQRAELCIQEAFFESTSFGPEEGGIFNQGEITQPISVIASGKRRRLEIAIDKMAEACDAIKDLEEDLVGHGSELECLDDQIHEFASQGFREENADEMLALIAQRCRTLTS